MPGVCAPRSKTLRRGVTRALLALLGLACASAWAQPAPGPSSSAPSGGSPEAEIRALIGKDLYPGETIDGLTVLPEPEQSRIAARWRVNLIDDGRHFHPLFHPPTIILYETLPGEAHFPARGTALAPKADASDEFRTWQKKLSLTRSLMRQVVVLRCMLYCRHQMDALDQDNLKAAEQELSTLTVKPSAP